MRFAYPARLVPESDGGFSVTFPDVPEAITQGETEAEALAMAEDALVAALSFYTDDGRALPPPSRKRDRHLVAVPALVAAKLALHEAMREHGMSKVELARRMALDEKAVRRLLDPLHASRIGQVEAALRQLGKRLIVEEMAAA